MEFEWDTDKADANLEKHGVSFLDARSVFLARMPLRYMIRIIPTTKIVSLQLDLLLMVVCLLFPTQTVIKRPELFPQEKLLLVK